MKNKLTEMALVCLAIDCLEEDIAPNQFIYQLTYSDTIRLARRVRKYIEMER